MAGKDLKLELLRNVPLFSGCAAHEMRFISKLADEVDVPAGKVLAEEGTTGHEFFIVVEGSVRVERGGAVINRLGPGDFAGEIALVDRGPRTASLIADVPSRVLVIGHREFHSLLLEYPSIQITVLQALARRVRHTDPEAIH
jgi:CRP-like cAMP-binding protein